MQSSLKTLMLILLIVLAGGRHTQSHHDFRRGPAAINKGSFDDISNPKDYVQKEIHRTQPFLVQKHKTLNIPSNPNDVSEFTFHLQIKPDLKPEQFKYDELSYADYVQERKKIVMDVCKRMISPIPRQKRKERGQRGEQTGVARAEPLILELTVVALVGAVGALTYVLGDSRRLQKEIDSRQRAIEELAYKAKMMDLWRMNATLKADYGNLKKYVDKIFVQKSLRDAMIEHVTFQRLYDDNVDGFKFNNSYFFRHPEALKVSTSWEPIRCHEAGDDVVVDLWGSVPHMLPAETGTLYEAFYSGNVFSEDTFTRIDGEHFYWIPDGALDRAVPLDGKALKICKDVKGFAHLQRCDTSVIKEDPLCNPIKDEDNFSCPMIIGRIQEGDGTVIDRFGEWILVSSTQDSYALDDDRVRRRYELEERNTVYLLPHTWRIRVGEKSQRGGLFSTGNMNKIKALYVTGNELMKFSQDTIREIGRVSEEMKRRNESESRVMTMFRRKGGKLEAAAQVVKPKAAKNVGTSVGDDWPIVEMTVLIVLVIFLVTWIIGLCYCFHTKTKMFSHLCCCIYCFSRRKEIVFEEYVWEVCRLPVV